MSGFGLKLEPGTFWVTLLCQDMQVPPWTLFEFNSLTVVFKTAPRSAFSYWDSQQFQVPGLSVSKHSSSEGTHREEGAQQQQIQQQVPADHRTLQLALPPAFHYYTISSEAPRPPLLFGKATCLCPCREGKHSSEFWLAENLPDFLFLSSGGWFHFSGRRSLQKQKPRIKTDFTVIFLNLEVYWW